ncbi:Uncharacterised protein [Shigella flexneri]|nr:Uncharacterised protein [Shigella flexneri]
MFDHFSAEIAHTLVGKLGFIFQVRATRDIQCAAGKAFVHRQHKTKAANTAFVAEGNF